MNQVIVLNKEIKKIEFANKTSSLVPLTPMDLYNLLHIKKDIFGISYREIIIDQEVSALKVVKSQNELVVNVDIGSEFASLSFELTSVFKTRQLNVEEVIFITENNYLIKNGEVLSVDKESVLFTAGLLEKLDASGNLPLLLALELYSQRDKYSCLKFSSEQLDFKQILESNLYTGNSSLFIRDLYDYQKDGLKWLQYCCINKIGGILGDDMGLGKTAQIIALTAWLLERKIFENILIVVPSTLLENWKREFLFFSPALEPYVHHGSVRTGSVELLKSKDIVITSYSMIINDQYLFNKLKWGAIIIDEASLIKNPDSERKISLSNIEAEVKIAMTGTPVENSLLDLWSLTDFVLPGYFGTRESFTNKFIKKDIEQTLIESDLSSLRNETSFIMLRRKKEDVLDSLPDKIDIHQALEMYGNEASLYNNERESILARIKTESPANVFTLIQNLRQYTTHPLLLDSPSFENADVKQLSNASSKFTRTIEILDEIRIRNEKVIIFTEYLKMIDTFKRVLEEHYATTIFTIDGRVEVSERHKRIDDFSAFEGFSIMVLNPKTAGMGLNITAANHVIHYTRQWNPALEEQATARSYRNKQEKNVNVYYLYYVNTIEEMIDNRLRNKRQLSGEVVTSTSDDLSFDDYLSSLSKTPIIK
ncbi:DEAD/DEAH box helicase [Kaistella pullorum]|uniref:DEAD/DEAH box helicase n=1 Tax=Kaistella pullorum TaxID=2763074 RepID=A0ABR8WL51_9FLAO|nr:DEAD/DEAH box helicase [Kaistella pullorum]MBD8017792.1 DEAD/DEAH box helicase [Kaistella pullorum]